MDQTKFISVVKEFPQVWDRHNTSFRDKDQKNSAWEKIGNLMNSSANACRDMFKSLREKYIREREKQSLYGDKYLPWKHLDRLKFLDPHIVLRKLSLNFEDDLQQAEEYKNTFNQDSLLMNFSDVNHSDFDRALIALVRKATPIWDRKSNSYPSKELKVQLWKTISQTMNKDMSICMLRWKGLREKYIRQRNKYQEGEDKWEFLDDMSFLDKVIQYRRKNSDTDSNYRYTIPRPEVTFQQFDNNIIDTQFSNNTNSNSDNNKVNNEIIDDNSVNDSSNDFMSGMVKQENFNYDIQQDSSYDSGVTSSVRKRSASDNSDCSTVNSNKKERIDYMNSKTPEQVFGDFVAAMLTKKTERDKNIAMIEIMKILTK